MDLTYGRGYVYSLQYHIVWCTKYRRCVLKDGIDEDCKSRQNQDHCCVKPQNIDEYIAAQNAQVQPRLKELRDILRAALPDAEERISWSMPTFWKGRNIIHFAAAKKHIGLYPGDGATAAFKDELTGFDVSKGTIRLPYNQALPADLIGRIAKWCYDEADRCG